jgi:hypothetical protein
MRILIRDIYFGNGRTYVLFETRFGGGAGIWKGKAVMHNTNCDVELEVPDCLKWNFEISSAGTEVESITRNGNSSIIVGKIEFVDHNSVMSVRVGDDMLSVEVAGLSKRKGYVEMKPSVLELYDINL